MEILLLSYIGIGPQKFIWLYFITSLLCLTRLMPKMLKEQKFPLLQCGINALIESEGALISVSVGKCSIKALSPSVLFEHVGPCVSVHLFVCREEVGVQCGYGEGRSWVVVVRGGGSPSWAVIIFGVWCQRVVMTARLCGCSSGAISLKLWVWQVCVCLSIVCTGVCVCVCSCCGHTCASVSVWLYIWVCSSITRSVSQQRGGRRQSMSEIEISRRTLSYNPSGNRKSSRETIGFIRLSCACLILFLGVFLFSPNQQRRLMGVISTEWAVLIGH